MALTYIYTDAYLKTRVTEAIEGRAIEEVDAIRQFPETPVDWRGKLIRLRTYVITCEEQGSTNDDVFAFKLATYRKEYESTLANAHAAANAADTTTPGITLLSIDMERA